MNNHSPSQQSRAIPNLKFKDFYTLTFVDFGYYNPNDPFLGVVQCPGFICMKTNRPLRHGAVYKNGDALELWGTWGDSLPDNSSWDYEIRTSHGIFNKDDFDLVQNLPEVHKPYFRALNIYRRILPDNPLVKELLQVYHDDGTLTLSQRRMVEKRLFAGKDASQLGWNYLVYCGLDMLAKLGSRPGLDQAKIQKLMQEQQTRAANEEDEQFLFDKLAEFSALIRPFSARLAANWPPYNRVLHLE